MSDVKEYRRKSNDLLKQAVRARNVGLSDQLLDESILWSHRATAAERASRGDPLSAPNPLHA